MLQRSRYLTNVIPNAFFGKANVLLDGALHDLLEVPLFGPFYSDKEFVQLVVNEPVEVLDDVRMI